MRLLIAAIGKLKQGPERDLFAHYLGRAEAAGRKFHLSPLATIEVAESKAATAKARKEAEAEMLLAKIPSSHRLIGLDPKGVTLTSEAFAGLLASLATRARRGSPSLSAARTVYPKRPWPRPEKSSRSAP